MSEETKKEVAEVKNIGWFKKQWKTIVTGVTCAVVGAGVMFGADTVRIQETIAKSEAKNAVIAAATYSAETAITEFAEKSKLVLGSADKTTAIANAIEAGKKAGEAIIDAKTTVVEEVKTAVEEVKKTEAPVTTAKETTEKAVEKATEKVEAKPVATTTEAKK